jgi:hypothetical protein
MVWLFLFQLLSGQLDRDGASGTVEIDFTHCALNSVKGLPSLGRVKTEILFIIGV